MSIVHERLSCGLVFSDGKWAVSKVQGSYPTLNAALAIVGIIDRRIEILSPDYKLTYRIEPMNGQHHLRGSVVLKTRKDRRIENAHRHTAESQELRI